MAAYDDEQYLVASQFEDDIASVANPFDDDDSDNDPEESPQCHQNKILRGAVNMLRSASAYPMSIHEDVLTKLPDLEHPPQDTKSFFWGIILMLFAAFFSSVTTTILKYNHLSHPTLELFVFRMLIQLLLTVVVASISVVRSHSYFYSVVWSASESVESGFENDHLDFEQDFNDIEDEQLGQVENELGIILPPNSRLHHHYELPRRRRCCPPVLCCKVRCVCTTVFAQFWRNSTSQTKWYILARGICGGTGAVCYYRAVSLIPFMDCLFVLSLFPCFSALCAKYLLHEHISRVHAAALLMTVVGTLTMTNPSFLFGKDDRDDRVYNLSETDWGDICEGYGLALVGSICYGFVFVFIRLAYKAPTFALIFSNGLFGCVEAIVICTLSHRMMVVLYSLTIRECAIAAGIGAIGYLAQNAENRSGKCCFASLAAMIRVTEVLWQFVWQRMGATQPAGNSATIGAGLLTLAIVVVICDKYREIRRVDILDQMEGDTQYNTELDSDNMQLYKFEQSGI